MLILFYASNQRRCSGCNMYAWGRLKTYMKPEGEYYTGDVGTDGQIMSV
jgi:hypothetical protein